MRKLTFLVVLCLLVCSAGVYIGRQRASAASCFRVDACGYFTGDLTSAANFNVLPGSALSGVTAASKFIGIISGDLSSGDRHSSMGAAYIVDAMLNYRGTSALPAGGGVPAGVAYARDKNNFGAWKALVNYYASSTSPSAYGITWNYKPDEQTFCGTGNKYDSAYDDGVTPPTHGHNDVAVYTIPPYGTQGCTLERNASMPEIQFHWQGGSFDIGTLCGNLQDTIDPIPSDHQPTRTITVSCDGATGRQTATVDFSDSDGATTGYVTLGSWRSVTVSSGSARQIALPTADPYTVQTVILHVLDVGPAPPGTYVTSTASTDVPCVAVACGSLTVTPLPLDPYTKYSVEVSATNIVNQAPPGASFTVSIKNPGGTTAYSGSQAASGAGGVSTATFSNLGPANAAGVYTVDWHFTTSSGIDQSCSGTFPVVYLPYLNVYGGDVSTGSVAANGDGTTCALGASAGIFSWNNHSTNFSGAGAQYAVQAVDTITDFASGLSSTNTAPLGLAMANTWDTTRQDMGQGLFGGFFGSGTPNCDLTSDLRGVAAITVNHPIGSQTVNSNNDLVYVKNADVYISGNVVYASTGGWANISSIPYFKLVVVGGSIYIDKSVSELDGIYVAEPSGVLGTGGRIYTCATGFGAPVNPAIPGSYTLCNTKLTVYGAFAAASVQFGRTIGSVGQANGDTLASNHDAEVFDYTPEAWLPRGATKPGNGYTAITGLPPVL